jgi:hypothetical protein
LTASHWVQADASKTLGDDSTRSYTGVGTAFAPA